MLGFSFEWDEYKNRVNVQKHGISFAEAITAFRDENALVITDEDHSVFEERFILIGLSKHLRLLVVCHCFRNNDEIIRIISARKANKTEEAQYGGTL